MVKVGKYQAPAKCTSCGGKMAVPGRGIWKVQCNSCGWWNTNRKKTKPKVDMTWLKIDLLEVALGMDLDVSEKDNKSELIAAIEAAPAT